MDLGMKKGALPLYSEILQNMSSVNVFSLLQIKSILIKQYILAQFYFEVGSCSIVEACVDSGYQPQPLKC